MLRAVGFADADFGKPIVGVASTWSMLTPCNMHIDQLARDAAAGADQAGGKAIIFGTITVSDGISMGTPGMRYSMVSREVIADSVETVAGAEGSVDGITRGQPRGRCHGGCEAASGRGQGRVDIGPKVNIKRAVEHKGRLRANGSDRAAYHGVCLIAYGRLARSTDVWPEGIAHLCTPFVDCVLHGRLGQRAEDVDLAGVGIIGPARFIRA